MSCSGEMWSRLARWCLVTFCVTLHIRTKLQKTKKKKVLMFKSWPSERLLNRLSRSSLRVKANGCNHTFERWHLCLHGCVCECGFVCLRVLELYGGHTACWEEKNIYIFPVYVKKKGFQTDTWISHEGKNSTKNYIVVYIVATMQVANDVATMPRGNAPQHSKTWLNTFYITLV